MALNGIYSALISPYSKDGSIDHGKIASMLEFQARLGLDGVYVGGSSGEAMLHTQTERIDVLKSVAAARGGLKLMAHIGSIGTREVLELSDSANEAGYDAVSAISPFYYKFSEKELISHYVAIADRSAVPLVIYNFPDKGLGLSMFVCEQLLAHDNIAGVKYTSSDLHMLNLLKTRFPNKLFFNGFDEICLAGLSMGADGAIGTTYNFMGDVFVAIEEHYKAGRMSEALALQTMANRVIAVLYVSIIDGTKYALERMGMAVGRARVPFQPLEWANIPDADAAIDAVVAWRSQQVAAR